jgi:hypothetical protein
MNLIKPAIIVLLTLVFTGCQSPTPYKSAAKTDSNFGYKSKKIKKDIYRVSFKGNKDTKRETVEQYMLFRAAEVAKNNKAPYFQIVSRDTDKIVDYDTVYTNMAFTRPYTTGMAGYNNYRYPYYSYGYGWSYNQGTTVVADDLYSTVAYIKLKDKASKNEKVFTTKEVISRLEKNTKNNM